MIFKEYLKELMDFAQENPHSIYYDVNIKVKHLLINKIIKPSIIEKEGKKLLIIN